MLEREILTKERTTKSNCCIEKQMSKGNKNIIHRAHQYEKYYILACNRTIMFLSILQPVISMPLLCIIRICLPSHCIVQRLVSGIYMYFLSDFPFFLQFFNSYLVKSFTEYSLT